MSLEVIEQVIGLSAGFLTTVSFLPQVIRTVKTKSSRDLSLGMVILFIIGVFLWLSYGIMKGEQPIIIANAVTLCLTIVLLFCKLRYK